MKRTIFLSLFFILLALPSWAQKSQEVQTVSADQELLKLTLKVDCSNDEEYVGTGCSGGLEEAAKTYSILKVTPAPSGGIVPDGLYLEKHDWDEEDERFIVTEHHTELEKTDTQTDTIIHYPYGKKGDRLTIKYRAGTFDPKTKTQDLSIESIRGLASLREKGEETKKNISYRWKIKQKKDGSLELWETNPTEFKLKTLEMGIGAWFFGEQQGATYLKRLGEREVDAEDGTKKKVPFEQEEIVLKASAKNEEPALCSASSSAPSAIKKLINSTHSIFSKI